MNQKFSNLRIVTALLFLFTIGTGLFAQVKIGDNPTTKNAASVLELESTNKALLISRVANTSAIATPINGMMIYDISAQCVRFYQNNSWSNCVSNTNSTNLITALSCVSTTFSPTTVFASNTYNGTATVPYTGGTGVPYSAESGISSTGVTGLTATLEAGTLHTNGNLIYNITGTPNAAGTASFAITFGGHSCTMSIAVITPSGLIPASLTLAQSRKYFVASVFDQNYVPYTAPVTAATTATGVNPDGTSETPTINVQGSITTTGINVKIPATATGGGTLLAYSTTVNVPASLTEDGISRDITLSWAGQTYTSATKSITVNIKSVGGTLNAKKLDINAGIGNDYLGILLGTFNYPYNNAGSLTTYHVRDLPGIPDKMIGLADNGGVVRHNFLYMPVVGEDGNIWLNNNLGADYANIDHSSFNLAQQANTSTDHHAYGSFIQWGRKPDGHELITWTSGTTGTAVNGITGTRIDNPVDVLFILSGSGTDWRITSNDALWATEASENNPCPSGFRVPTATEQSTLFSAANILNPTDAVNSNLKLSIPGNRNYGNGLLGDMGYVGHYWSSSVEGALANYRGFNDESTSKEKFDRGFGLTVRCIKN